MSIITTSLPEDRMSELTEIAAGLGTTPEELVRASVEDLLGRPEEFQKAVDYVLKKNQELYKRLFRAAGDSFVPYLVEARYIDMLLNNGTELC